MSILLILFFITLSTCFGFVFLLKFNSFALMERVGNSFLIGLFLSTIIFFIDYIIFQNFSIVRPSLFMLSVVISIFILQKKNVYKIIKSIRNINFEFNKSYIFIIVIVSLYLFSTILINYLWPINDWDSIALYDFRAKLVEYGSWEPGIKFGYFFHYPPYTSLLHGISYLLGFKQVKVFYTLMFVAYLFVFYGLFSKKISKKLSYFGVLLLTFAPLTSGHVLIAYTNLPYTIFFSLGTIYSLEWITNKNRSSLYLSLMYLSASIWVRNAEPFWIIPIFLIIISQIFSRRKITLIDSLPIILFFIGMYKLWPTYVSLLSLPQSVNVTYDNKVSLDLSLQNIFFNLFSVTQYLFKYFILPLISLVIPFVYIIFFDKKIRSSKYLLLLLTTIGFFSLIVFAGTFYFSFTFETWNQIGGSVERMIMLFEPLMIFFIMHSSLWFFDDK